YTEAPNTQTLPTGFNLLFPDVYQDLIDDEFRGNFITDVSYGNSEPLADAFLGAAAQYVPGLKVEKIHTSALLPDLLRSDHAWFWLAGVPALMITDGADFRNPYYHSPQDKSEFLNFTFMRQVVQATVATLAAQAGIQHATTWWTDTDFFTPATEVTRCDIYLSPNPASDFIRVGWGDCINSRLEYELIDLQGQTVVSKKMPEPATTEAMLKVGNLPSGVYFLRIISAEKQWVRKVAVNH
ncbi:MAG: T9SS type A sorting domain-containing protein, partial [Saprospiraceae bacterium]